MSKSSNEEDKAGSIKAITSQLDKYLKEETTFKSTVETVKRLYKLSKSKASGTSHTCFLCKSSIDDSALQAINDNFLKKDSQNEKTEQKLLNERATLIKLIENHNASTDGMCTDHKSIMGEI
jgi:chaperonin GroEL (HSP60 family)